MADRKGRRRSRASSRRQSSAVERTFFGDKDPLDDFEAELGDSLFSPDPYAEGDDDQSQFVTKDTEAIFGGTEKILADADTFSKRIERRRSLAGPKDTTELAYRSEADMSRGPRTARRGPQSRSAGVAKKSQAKKGKTATRDFYDQSDRDKKTKTSRRKPVKSTAAASDEELSKRERDQQSSAESVRSSGGVSDAADKDAPPPPAPVAPQPAMQRIPATQEEQDDFITASKEPPKRPTRESRRSKSSEGTDGGSQGTAEGLTVADLAMVLLDVLSAEQQQQQQRKGQLQEELQQTPRTRQQPPCEACASQENLCGQCGTLRRGQNLTLSRCDKCESSYEERESGVPKTSKNHSPMRRPERSTHFYETAESDYDYAESRRKPKKLFSQAKRGSRGTGRHRSETPTAIEETTATQVVETSEEAPNCSVDPRYGYVAEKMEPYYGDGYDLLPHDYYGQEAFYSYFHDANAPYYGNVWEPGPAQACLCSGPYGAAFPVEWPQRGPYAELCPCVKEAPQETILRREEVWTEDGKHRHRVQEILEGSPASPSGANIGLERFKVHCWFRNLWHLQILHYE
ncbi:uncharacterized protein LOC144120050 [Amblyomma americanum]